MKALNLPKRFGLFIALLLASQGWGQETEIPVDFVEPSDAFWLGTYSNFRVTDKLFWAAETHFRTVGTEAFPYFGRMGQLYNRHGVKYLFSKNFSATVGGVLRLDFSPDPGNENLKKLVLEPRIWHEYLFAMPLGRMMVYHRLRIEHRWSKGHEFEEEYIYRDRWRYKILAKIPLNRPALQPGAFYFSPDVELILQSGKPVGGSVIEDLRIYPMLGYIQSPQIGYSAGFTYTMGQRLAYPNQFRQRYILRLNCYLSLDWRKIEDRIPKAKLYD